LARGLRVSLGLVFVAACFGVIAVRATYARAADAGLDFGEELRQMTERNLSGDLTGEVYQLAVNGQPFDSSNIATSRPMREVLDYFQDQCTNNGDGLGDSLQHLRRTVRELPRTAGHPGFMIVRKDAEDRGFVFCMGADHELSTKEKIERINLLASTGDLGQVGDVRYVAVAKDPGGSSTTSMWTHGTFNINAMFPKSGDAPGEDLGAVPRPAGSRRILTGLIVGAPFGVNAYEFPGAPKAAMAAVDSKLAATGWKAVSIPDMNTKGARFYSLGNAMDVVVTARGMRGGRSNVAYMVSRGVGTVSR